MKFELNREESQTMCVFIDSHGTRCKVSDDNLGAIGGRWIYEIVETSIGQILNVKCGVCGTRECLNALDI
jgi:hypothetical protein